jgi:hypothetical protein
MRIYAPAASAFLCVINLACGPAPDSSFDLEASKSKRPPSLTEDQIQALAESKHFPIRPDSTLTPGVRCKKPDEVRYPEKISYCERRVSTSLKDRVIRDYDSQLGYEVDQIARNKIKIDHYIPLCMGGDNAKANLWPQHEALYTHTDPLENQLCLALARGLITQNEAIDDMLSAKSHTDSVADLMAKIKLILR